MSFWKKILNLKRKPSGIQDEIFGFLDNKSEVDIYGKKVLSKNLRGKIFFDSVEVKIELKCIDNVANKFQKEFFLRLTENFEIIKSKELVPLLEEELINWVEKQPVKINFDMDCILHKIFLPDCFNKPINWKLIVLYAPLNHFITINFQDFTPLKEIQIDV